MFSFLSFISVTGGCSQWEYKKNKSQFETKINNCFSIISISNLNANLSVLCSNKLICVVVVLHISPTVPVKYLSFKIFKFCSQTIPNATSVSTLSELRIDFSLRKGGMLSTMYLNLYLGISNSLIINTVLKSINN